MAHRIAALAIVSVLAVGCGSDALRSTPSIAEQPSTSTAPEPAISRVTCGGPAFDLARLDQPGNAEQVDDPAAAALRGLIFGSGPETEWLPDAGWIEVVRTPDTAYFVAPGGGAPFSAVSAERRDGHWAIGGWQQCRLEPEVPAGAGLAEFRVAPGEALTRETTEVDLLVTEMACNSGEDAQGRILPPQVFAGADSLTVVVTVRPRGGAQTCQGNPETPFLLELPEPLGDRLLLDGSSVPARDATTCPDAGMCP
jgi:hypothetical protein